MVTDKKCIVVAALALLAGACSQAPARLEDSSGKASPSSAQPPDRGLEELVFCVAIPEAYGLATDSESEQPFHGQPHCNTLGIKTIEEVVANRSLKRLALHGDWLGGLAALRSLSNLEELTIYHSSVTDHSALASFARLRSLTLDSCAAVATLEPLAAATSLTRLELHHTRLEEPHSLGTLRRLEHLTLTNIKLPADVLPLAELRSLQFSTDEDAPKLHGFGGLTKLEDLRLDGAGISDLSWLTGLVNLEVLSVHGTTVKKLEPLSGLAGLRVLDLRETPVTTISALVGLTELRELSLRGTAISSIKELATLTKLKRLDISETQVRELRPLARLSELEKLDVAKTPVKKLTWLHGLSKLIWLGVPARFENTNELKRLREILPRLEVAIDCEDDGKGWGRGLYDEGTEYCG